MRQPKTADGIGFTPDRGIVPRGEISVLTCKGKSGLKVEGGAGSYALYNSRAGGSGWFGGGFGG